MYKHIQLSLRKYSPMNLVKLMIQKRPDISRDKTEHLEVKVKLTFMVRDSPQTPFLVFYKGKKNTVNAAAVGQLLSGHPSVFLQCRR